MPSPGKASTLFQLHPRLSIVIIFAQSLMIILIIVTQPKYCWWSTFPRHPSPPPPPLGCWWTSPASWSGSPAAWPRPAHSFCSPSHLWGSSAPQRLCFLFASFLVEECQDVQISTAPSSGARCPERCHCAQNWGTSWTVLLIPTSLDLRSLIVEIALTSVLNVFQCLVKPELTGSSWIFKPQVRSTDTLNSLCTV